MDEKKNIGLYDEELILDDGHDTAKELELKNSNKKSLAQWREEARKLKSERDKHNQTGDSKPPMERSKEDDELVRK